MKITAYLASTTYLASLKQSKVHNCITSNMKYQLDTRDYLYTRPWTTLSDFAKTGFTSSDFVKTSFSSYYWIHMPLGKNLARFLRLSPRPFHLDATCVTFTSTLSSQPSHPSLEHLTPISSSSNKCDSPDRQVTPMAGGRELFP